MKKILRFNLVILLCGIVCSGSAQYSFKFSAATDKVVANGFYKVNVLPAIMAKCRPTLGDLRLLDADGKQVPYIIKNGETFKHGRFEPFKKISEVTDAGGIYRLEIENTRGEAINNLVLILKNSVADRSVNIGGSNDSENWYAIKEFINLEKVGEQDNDKFIQTIALPKVTYKYFKIAFNEKLHDPMFIDSIGTYINADESKNYFPVPDPVILQKDSSDGYSYVTLISAENYRLDKQQIFASGSKFYQRNLLFDKGYYDADKESKTATLSSASDNIFFMNFREENYRTDTISFRIQNNDNPPVHIDSVKLYQQGYAMYTYLQAGQQYQLTFGNDSIKEPVYDLAAFADSINTATLLATQAIIPGNLPATNIAVKPQVAKTWLWLTIGVVLVLLLLITASLLRQVKNKEADQ